MYFEDAQEGIPPKIGRVCKNLHLNCIVSFGQDNLLGGQFWAMGRLNLLDGQSNLLGGQMPTQLTCYLPPWSHERLNWLWIIWIRP